MILILAFRGPGVADVSYLLHKNPMNVARRATAAGEAVVFWPRYDEDGANVALLLKLDTIAGTKGRNKIPTLDDYVNDRPWTCNSFMAVALRECFATALAGRCEAKPEALSTVFGASVVLPAVHAHGGADLVGKLCEPLGYDISVGEHAYDRGFPAWGASPIVSVCLRGRQTVRDVLRHLYVLMPVMDTARHYWVGDTEVEKLLRHGEGWLETHPARGLIAKRFTAYRSGLAKDVMERLDALVAASAATAAEAAEGTAAASADAATTEPEPVAGAEASAAPVPAPAVEAEPTGLGAKRILAVTEMLAAHRDQLKRVIDLGCGEGKLVEALAKALPETTEIIGVDASAWTLGRAKRRLKVKKTDTRIRFMQGAATHRDARLRNGVDANAVAVALVEVIEHLDLERLAALRRAVFGYLRPKWVILTTPNREYNVLWENVGAARFRHRDHRFEWTRDEFAAWCNETASGAGYGWSVAGVGDEDPEKGSPTQMAVFERVAV